MGMSTHVMAFRPPDEEWQRMKAVWDACQAAKIPIPQEVDSYFDGDAPDPAGVEIPLTRYPTNQPSVREWSDEYRSGYEVLLDQLPAGTQIVRFYNSW